jgi:hypothetical protein
MSTITDRARDFWDRISPRERRLVVLGAVVAPIVLAVWLGLAIHDGLVAMDSRNARMRKALDVVADLRVRGQAPVDETDDIVKKMGTEPVKLHAYLDTAATKAGIKLKGTTPHTPINRNGFITNSVSCQLDKLTIDQLRAFLSEVEQSKVVAITRLDIRRDFQDKQKLIVQTLEVSTYSKEPPKNIEGAGSGGG